MKTKTYTKFHPQNPNPNPKPQSTHSIKSEISFLQASFTDHSKILEHLSSEITSYKEKNAKLRQQIANFYTKKLLKSLQHLTFHQQDEDPIFLEKVNKDQVLFQQLFESPDDTQSEISSLTEKFFMISYTVLNF